MITFHHVYFLSINVSCYHCSFTSPFPAVIKDFLGLKSLCLCKAAKLNLSNICQQVSATENQTSLHKIVAPPTPVCLFSTPPLSAVKGNVMLALDKPCSTKKEATRMDGRRWRRVWAGMGFEDLGKRVESKILLSKISITLPVHVWTCLMSLSLCLDFICSVQFTLLRPHQCRFRLPCPSLILFLSPVVQQIPISQCSMAQVDWAGPWCADRACTQPRASPFPSLGPLPLH